MWQSHGARAHAQDVQDGARSATERITLALLAFTALTAVPSGVALMLRAHGSELAPISLLEGTGFTSFLIPGLLLAIVVGGSSTAAVWLTRARSEYATDATLLAGGVLTFFIVCERALLRAASPLQAVYAAVGLALIAIAAREGLARPRTRFILFVTSAEAAGFSVPAIVGVTANLLSLGDATGTVLVVAAGSVEGALCGLGQAHAMPVPVDRRRFVAASSLGAATAWGIAMSLFGWLRGGAEGPLAIAVSIASAFACLFAMSGAQWAVLRHTTRNAHRWLLFSMLAWIAALPLSFAPSPLVDEASPPATSAVLFLSAGVAMAYVMSVLTWQGARGLVARESA